MPSERDEKHVTAGLRAKRCEEPKAEPQTGKDWHDIWMIQPQYSVREIVDRSNDDLDHSIRSVKSKSRHAKDIPGDGNAVGARTLARSIANATVAHSKQSRRIAEALIEGSKRQTNACNGFDLDKLNHVAIRFGIDPKSAGPEESARRIANEALGDHSRIGKEPLKFTSNTITKPRLNALQTSGLMPDSIDRAVEDVIHRTFTNGEADPMSIIFDAIACSIADYDSMHISTDLSDVIRGTPRLVRTDDRASLKAEVVNIAGMDLSPSLQEAIAQAARRMEDEARAAGSSGINIVQIDLVGDRKQTVEVKNSASLHLALATGMIDILVGNHHCLRLALADICACGQGEANPHLQFSENDVEESARIIVTTAIEAFRRRTAVTGSNPRSPQDIIVGFSLEQIEVLFKRLAPNDPLTYLTNAIHTGKIRGIALIVGCDESGSQRSHRLAIAKELLKNNVLVLSAGCLAKELAREGMFSQKAVDEFAGDGLRSFIDGLSEANQTPLPAIWHIGSCGDTTRAMDLATAIAKHLGADVSAIPFVVSAPGAVPEKLVSVGTWCVALGMPVHVDGIDFLNDSPLVVETLTNTARDVLGANFIVEADPSRAAKLLLNEIERRRWHLKLGHRYQVPKGVRLSQEDLFRKAIEGAIIATGYASQLLSTAIDRYGNEEEVEFPETAYTLPSILAWQGREIHQLGDMPIALEQVRAAIGTKADLQGALVAGEAVMVAAEVVEALKYVRNERPYEGTSYCGFIPDKVIRELGIAIVDDTIPGCAVLIGAAQDPKQLVKIVRDCQSKGMLIVASYDTIRQLQDEGIKTGLDVRLYPVGEFTQIVHGLNFAIRVALTFGGVQRGDRERLAGYLVKRPKVFVLQLGPMDAIKIGAEFAALLNGSPTITDQDIENIPDKFISQYSYEQLVQTAIELRGIQVKLAPVDLPVAYGPAFEGETVRRPDTYVEAGGAARTLAFEILRQKPESEVEDGKVSFIGKDLDSLPEGSKTTLAIIIDVYGKKMQGDFESVLERRIHQFVNFAEGVWHTGQRNTIWVRISKSSVKSGFRFKHFGDILVAKIKEEFGNIVSRVQVTIVTDEAEATRLLPEALEKYRVRDQRLAGLTDESVSEFYSCSLCLPANEEIMLADGSFLPIEILIEDAADYGPRSVLSFATDHLIARPMKELFTNPSPKELVQITLSNGNGIALTPNHKVLVDTKEGLKWIAASNLKSHDVLIDAMPEYEEPSSGSLAIIDYLPDDYRISDDHLYADLKLWVIQQSSIGSVAQQLGIEYHRLYSSLYLNQPTRQRLTIGETKRLVKLMGRDWNELKETVHVFQSDARITRTKLDTELMYAVGLIASDGCLRWRGEGGKSGVFVQFTNTEPELTSQFAGIVENLFGCPPDENVVPPTTIYSDTLIIRGRKPVTVSLVYNTLFGRLISGLGVGRFQKEHKWMGHTISKLPRELVAAFLEGLFDGDGYVTANRVGITTRSSIEARHLHLLLKRIGIATYIAKGDRGYSVCTSSDEDAIRFRERIGSRHPEKKLKMDAIRARKDSNHVVRSDAVTLACGKHLASLIEEYSIETSKLPVDYKTINAWRQGRSRPSKGKLTLVLNAIEAIVPTGNQDFAALRSWSRSDVRFQKIKSVSLIPYDQERVFNFSVDDTHNYIVNGIVVKNCESFAPDHICIITPERLGLCGAINWLDAKASREIAPTGPNQPIKKGEAVDERKGQWTGVNRAVLDLSHGKLEQFNVYCLMEYPMTSCGCFEVVVAMTADAQAVIAVNREYPSMTPIGMKFSTLAGSIGGGRQTPGFIGVGRKYLLSKKFISADGGLLRIAWMPKDLKNAMADGIRKRAEELGVPDFLDKIADETIATDAEGLANWMVRVDHPALKMPSLLQ